MAMSDKQASLKIDDDNNITIDVKNSKTLHIEHKKNLNNDIPWTEVVPYYLALYAHGDPQKNDELNLTLQSCKEDIYFDEFVTHFIKVKDINAYFKVLQISLFFVPLLFKNQSDIDFKEFLEFYVKKICNIFLLFQNVKKNDNTLINEIVEFIAYGNPILFIKERKDNTQIIDYLANLAITFQKFNKNEMKINKIKNLAKKIPNELPKNFRLDDEVNDMLQRINLDMFNPENDIIMYDIYNKFYDHYTNSLKLLGIEHELNKDNIQVDESLKNFYDKLQKKEKYIYKYLYNLRRHKCKKLIEKADDLFTKSVKLVQGKETTKSTNLQENVKILELKVETGTDKLVRARTKVKKAQNAVLTIQNDLKKEKDDNKKKELKQKLKTETKNLKIAEKTEKEVETTLKKNERKLEKNSQGDEQSSGLVTAAKYALGAAAAATAIAYAPTIYGAIKGALTGSPASSGTGGAANVANVGNYTGDLGTEGAANVGNVAGFKGTRPSDTSTTTFETPDGRIVNVKVNCNVNKELIKAKLKAQQLKERLKEMEYNYEELVSKSEQCFGKQDEDAQKKATAAMAAKIRRASLSKERKKLEKRNLSPKDCMEELARARARLRNLGKRP